jgi:type II secretory pathway pseudopilin PulG
VSNILALLRDTLPEFLGSLSAAAVTGAAVAAVRTARLALRRRRTDPSRAHLPPSQD